MLTPSQRELIESGEIRNDGSAQVRVRNNIDETLKDLNLVFRNYKWIEGQNSIDDFMDQDVTKQLVTNLLYILEDDLIDENLLWMLLEGTEDCWTVEGSDHVHGHKQQLALTVFMNAFKNFDHEDPMCPDPEDIDGWEEFEMLYQYLSDGGVEMTYDEEDKDE